MSEEIKVHVVRYPDRANLVMRYVDPYTGRQVLNGQEVGTYADVISEVRTLRPGDKLEIVIERSRIEQQLVATLGAQPNLRTATRRADVNVERTNANELEDQDDCNRDSGNRARYRDRNSDGNRDGALLRGRRN